MTDAQLDSRLEVAKRLAWQGGKQTLNHFQNASLKVEKKSDRSPVTIADRECEKLIRSELQTAFPEDGVVGEEFGETEGVSGFRWILDPIDGTKSFISGVPLYGTMVAVEKDGEAIVGVVYVPGLDEGVFAAKGKGCWHQVGEGEPTKASVSGCSKLDSSCLVTSEVETFAEREAAGAYAELANRVYISRTWGDCYGYLLVATGRVEVMVDPILNIWDAAAVQPIVTEAGGRFTDWQGRERIDSGDAVGSNGRIHDEVLSIIRQQLAPSQ